MKIKHPGKELLKIRSEQRLLSLSKVQAQVARHRAARLAQQNACAQALVNPNPLAKLHT